jgi:hypothetical protein
MTMGGQDVTRMMPRDGNKGGHREDLRFEYQTRRDERLFDVAWLQDDGRRAHFRTTWRRDLALEHARYKTRMEAL